MNTIQIIGTILMVLGAVLIGAGVATCIIE